MLTNFKVPIFSIVTVVFNAKDDLEKTIKSVINQNFYSFEYIIIDGGSTDGSLDIINKNIEYIDFFKSEPDDGIYDAMNKGLFQSNGCWILFLNAGDVFCNNTVLSLVYPYMLDTNANYYGIANVMYEKESLYKKPSLKIKDFNKTLPIHQAFFLCKKYKNNLFNTNYKIVSDSFYLTNLNKISVSNFIPVEIVNFYLGGVSSWYSNYVQFSLHLREHLSLLKFAKVGIFIQLYTVLGFSLKFLLTLVLNKKFYFKIIGFVARIKN